MAAGNGRPAPAATRSPTFRIFNPVSQSGKFDADGKFIRKYLPVLEKLPERRTCTVPGWPNRSSCCWRPVWHFGGRTTRLPIVQHDRGAGKQTLQRYAVVKKAVALFCYDFHSYLTHELPGLESLFYPETSCLCRAIVPDQADQFVFRIWLAEIVINAQLHRVFTVFLGDARGDHDDRHALSAALSARMLRARSKPSMRGISMSDSTTAGTSSCKPLECLQVRRRHRDPEAFALQQTLRDPP